MTEILGYGGKSQMTAFLCFRGTVAFFCHLQLWIRSTPTLKRRVVHHLIPCHLFLTEKYIAFHEEFFALLILRRATFTRCAEFPIDKPR